MVEPSGGRLYGGLPAPLRVQGGARLAAASAAGRGHARCEDAFVLEPALGLAGVVDGLGGHEGAALAARLAVTTVRGVAALARAQQGSAEACGLLQRAFAAAEEAIDRAASREPALRRMGAALVLACARAQQLTVANVGDARAYLCGAGGLQRLTQDHSGAGQLLAAGRIDEADAGRHPARQPLLRVVGGNKRREPPAITRARLAPGDVVLLCSDGVWAVLPPSRIEALLLAPGAAPERARELVEAAHAAGGGDDDACAIVWDVGAGGEGVRDADAA